MNLRSTLFLSLAAAGIIMSPSCVSKKKFKAAQSSISRLQQDSSNFTRRIGALERNMDDLGRELSGLGIERSSLKNRLDSTSQVLDETSRAAAAKYAEQQKRLETLQSLINRQKQTTEALRKKMADALAGFKSNELTVTNKNGKVYVSLQEQLLFPSGSAVVNPKGKEALGKLAEVLTVNPDININIEGHTDSIPIKGKYEDNWALSVSRATSIVRILTDNYKIDSKRIIASGHSQFDPVDNNGNPEGRARNRRTEIILTPKLDELYKLIEEGVSL